MTLYNTLKEYGMFSNELRTRLKSNQILVNGESQKGDYELGNICYIYDQGFFLEELYKMSNYVDFSAQLTFFGLSNLMNGETNIKNELTDFLNNYSMIQISKEVAIFIKISDISVNEIIIHRETKGKIVSKIEQIQEVDQTELIDKLKNDKLKIEKQLSNVGFVNNAPKFKVDAVRKRLDNLINKLKEHGIN